MLIIERTNEAQHATLLLFKWFFFSCFMLNDNEIHPCLFLLALCQPRSFQWMQEVRVYIVACYLSFWVIFPSDWVQYTNNSKWLHFRTHVTGWFQQITWNSAAGLWWRAARPHRQKSWFSHTACKMCHCRILVKLSMLFTLFFFFFFAFYNISILSLLLLTIGMCPWRYTAGVCLRTNACFHFCFPVPFFQINMISLLNLLLQVRRSLLFSHSLLLTLFCFCFVSPRSLPRQQSVKDPH